MNTDKLNTILFNTTYLDLVPRPYTLLDTIITDYNELDETKQDIFIEKILENRHNFKVLKHFLLYSNNVDKTKLEITLNRRYLLQSAFLQYTSL